MGKLGVITIAVITVFPYLIHCQTNPTKTSNFQAPRITYISPNASVTRGYTYSVICEADGFPPPKIDWLDSNLDRIDGTPTLTGRSFIQVKLSDSDDFIEVTCMASQGNLSHAQTVTVSHIDSRECKNNLAMASEDTCFSTEGAEGFFLHGLVHNVTLYCPETEYGSVIDVEIILQYEYSMFQSNREDVLHKKMYESVICDNGGTATVNIQPPLLISLETSTQLIASAVIQDFDTYTYNDGFSGSGSGENSDSLPFGFVICQTLCSMENYTRVTDSCPSGLFLPEVEEINSRVELIRKCLMPFSEAPPVLTVQPEPVLEASFGGSVETYCEADNAIIFIWYKMTLHGNEKVSVNSNVIRFDSLDIVDQGVYFCRALGSIYEEGAFADSDPVVVKISGNDTYLMTMAVNGLDYCDELANHTSYLYLNYSQNIWSLTDLRLYEALCIRSYGYTTLLTLSGSVVADILVTTAKNVSVQDVKNTLYTETTEDSLLLANSSVNFQETACKDKYDMTMKFNGLVYYEDLDHPCSHLFVDYGSRIKDHISGTLHMYRLVESLDDVIVQRLRSGSVIAEMLVTLDHQKGTSFLNYSRNIPPSFRSSEPDWKSITLQYTSFCQGEILNDTLAGQLTFNRTTILMNAHSAELCPNYTLAAGKPRATRLCYGNFYSASKWQVPLLSNCFDTSDEDANKVAESMPFLGLLKVLESNQIAEDNVVQFSHDVADATSIVALGNEDVDIVAKLLEDIANFNSSSPQVTSNVVKIVDNVMHAAEKLDLESGDDMTPSTILGALEHQLANLHQGESDVNFTNVQRLVGAVAFTADKKDFVSNITFGNFFGSEQRNITDNLNASLVEVFWGYSQSHADSVKASITLPTSIVTYLQNDTSAKIPLTFIVYRTSSLFVSRDSEGKKEEVETFVISATIEGKNLRNLKDPVVTRFHLLPLENAGNVRRCVFWNQSLADGFRGWSSEGCRMVSGPGPGYCGDPVVQCVCNHLTNFAVLVDIRGDIGNIFLDILSIIGCTVSVVGLLITITSLTIIKKLREKQPQQILISLSVTMLGLYLSFLIGVDRSDSNTECVIFGALIHFFSLSSVSWMSVEATNMYFLFVRVFDSGVHNFMKKAALAAWGLPLVIVVVSVVWRPQNYTGEYCFPQVGTLTLYIGVLTVIGMLLAYNLVMFTLVIKEITCRRKFKTRDTKVGIRKRIQNSVAISTLLGIAWLFGYLAIGEARLLFNLLFLVFNSLQGFFVFLFFCLRNEDVRKDWMEFALLVSKPCLGDTKTPPSRVTELHQRKSKNKPPTGNNNRGGTHSAESEIVVSSRVDTNL